MWVTKKMYPFGSSAARKLLAIFGTIPKGTTI